MANFSTILLTIFMVMFWLFRGIVTLCTQFSIDLLGLQAYNFNWEVAILFLTLPCILLIAKRKMIGSLAYLAIYGAYFGEHLLITMLGMVQGNVALSLDLSMNLIFDLIGILLPVFVLLDMLVDKGRKANPIHKQTDWYFKNEKYDEQLKARDGREDKNEYKFY